MTRHQPLHPGFERLIGAAAVDRDMGRALLRHPRATALQFGLTPADADLVVDIRAGDLRGFAAALLPRLYGKDATHGAQRGVVAG